MARLAPFAFKALRVGSAEDVGGGRALRGAPARRREGRRARSAARAARWTSRSSRRSRARGPSCSPAGSGRRTSAEAVRRSRRGASTWRAGWSARPASRTSTRSPRSSTAPRRPGAGARPWTADVRLPDRPSRVAAVREKAATNSAASAAKRPPPWPSPSSPRQDFEREVLRSELPVLIDFYADWCAPCKTVAPEVEAIAHELEGKAKVVKVDIDRSQAHRDQSLRIQAVPTFMVFHKGRPVAAEQGVLQARPAPRDDRALPPAGRGRAPRDRAGAAHARGPGRAGRHARRRAPTAARASPAPRTSRSRRSRAASPSCTCSPARPILYCRSGDKTKEMADKLAEQGVPVGFLEGGLPRLGGRGAAHRAAGLSPQTGSGRLGRACEAQPAPPPAPRRSPRAPAPRASRAAAAQASNSGFTCGGPNGPLAHLHRDRPEGRLHRRRCAAVARCA